MKYLPPESTVIPLGYDWEPYEAVYPFCAAAPFKGIADWYLQSVPGCENTNEEKGKFEAYFEDKADSSEWSVLLADCAIRAAKDDFFSYVSCPQLEHMAAERKCRTVGALFRRKPRIQT